MYLQLVGVILCINFSHPLTAQKISFEGGILTGLHGADFLGDEEKFWNDDYEKSRILGIAAGPFVRCKFSPESFAVLELKYMGKGSTFGYINQFFTQSFETIRFRCVEIPVLYGSRGTIHGRTGDIHFSFETGLSFSRVFASTLNYDEVTQRTDKVSLYGFRNYDCSWIAQLHIPYREGKNYRILLGVLIERSLFSIHDNYKLYNFDYGFELCYLFKNT